MVFWQLLRSNARPSGRAPPAEVDGEAARGEVRWALERRLQEIDRRRRDHWAFAYATSAASLSIGTTILSHPAWATRAVGFAAAAGSTVLWLLWAVGHAATNAALLNARAGKDAAYAMLGSPIRETRATEAPLFDRIPVTLAALTSAAAAFATGAGLARGAGWT